MKNRKNSEQLISAKKGNPIALRFDEKSVDLGKIDFSEKR